MRRSNQSEPISRLRILLFLVFCLSSDTSLFNGKAFAQGSNIGGIIDPAGLKEPYGINDRNILDSQEYMTRQNRRVQESGIGGSFIQTTSPTSESSPAIRQNTIAPVVKESTLIPKLPQSMYGNIEKSPALYNDLTHGYSTVYSEKHQSFSSPALSNPGRESSSMSQSEGTIKVPHIEPIQPLDKHSTGGDSITPP